MTVQLSKGELEQFVEAQVKAGNFPTREAVVEAALAQMMLSDHDAGLMDADVIDESEEQIQRGDVHDWKEASAQLRKKYLGQ